MIPTHETCCGPRWQSPSAYYWRYDDRGWAIYRGVSRFLIAEGPAHSVRVGRDLLRTLKAKRHV
jgi:hypothetical protein